MAMDSHFVAGIFYGKLFEQNPELRHLFDSDMSSQYNKLMDTLNQVIMYVDSPEVWLTEIKGLAMRHLDYQVKQGHYDLVGKALLHTLQLALPDSWDAETELAWRNCYSELSSIMINEAYA